MEIVVLDKVLQIDTSVRFFILFSVYLRVVRSLELQLFNYYLQWYSDTRGNFLQFTNLHDLVTLGNHLECMPWKERWLFLQKCIYQLSKSKKCLNTSGSPQPVLFSSNISSEALTPWALVLLLSASSLLSWAWPSWLRELCRCLGACGSKILTRAFWGIKGGIRAYCRMPGKFCQGR